MKSIFFKRNRDRLAALVEGPVVLTAYTSVQKSADMSATFEQESNFWWLSGIESPDWKLVIDGRKSWLVAPEVSAQRRTFDGALSFDEAREISGVDTVILGDELPSLLEELAQKHHTVYTLAKDPHAVYYDFVLNPAQATLRRKLTPHFTDIQDCRNELARLRAVKQPEEIAALRQAIDLTITAFKEVRERIGEFTHEYHIEALCTYRLRNAGAKGHAYEPIVAAGKHACTLHYIQNQAKIDPHELVLIDIGARVDGYAADITRTYQVAEATPRQKAVHAAVESAQAEIISLLHPGLLVSEYHEKVDAIMKQKLDELGLLRHPGDEQKYFPHAISHGLGIDVHDALGRPVEFKAGMVLTVEPGIYIPEEGIGVRIEDDILITKAGHENLSAALPTSL